MHTMWPLILTKADADRSAPNTAMMIACASGILRVLPVGSFHVREDPANEINA